MTTLCPSVQDCQPRIAWDLIKHFVWFDNTRSGLRTEDLNRTTDCFDCLFLNTIPVDELMLPLELIWFENDERLNFEEVFDYTVSDSPEDYQDVPDVDQTEKENSLFNIFSASSG